jgi:hypothetical protein
MSEELELLEELQKEYKNSKQVLSTILGYDVKFPQIILQKYNEQNLAEFDSKTNSIRVYLNSLLEEENSKELAKLVIDHELCHFAYYYKYGPAGGEISEGTVEECATYLYTYNNKTLPRVKVKEEYEYGIARAIKNIATNGNLFALLNNLLKQKPLIIAD